MKCRVSRSPNFGAQYHQGPPHFWPQRSPYAHVPSFCIYLSSLEFSGDESEPPTPVKKQSNRSSRAVTPEKSKSAAAASKSNGCGGEKSNGSAATNKSQGEDDEDWTKYLGSDDEEKSSIVIRFPDGTRESKELPCSSKFKAIIKYVVSKGFPLNQNRLRVRHFQMRDALHSCTGCPNRSRTRLG